MGVLGRVWDRHYGKIIGAGAAYVFSGWFSKRMRASLDLEQACLAAAPYGDAPIAPLDNATRIQLVLNHKSGQGSVRTKFDENMKPVLQFGAVVYKDSDFEVLETEEPEHAKEAMADLQLDKFDGLAVVGGDGLLQEVVTGLLRRPDRAAVSKFPIAVIPVGSANAVASELRQHWSSMPAASISRATLAIVRRQVRPLDVLEISTGKGETSYAMSMVGWGVPGVMAAQSEKSAWLRSQRYWYGAAKMLAQFWDASSTKVRISYPKSAGDQWEEDEKESSIRPGWAERDLHVRCMVASKTGKVGPGIAMSDDGVPVPPGFVRLSWLPADECSTRRELYALGYRLSQGGTFDSEHGVKSIVLREFTVQYEEGSAPINVDGEAFDPRGVYIRVLPRALTFFTPPSEQ